jgi:hypothetical protein
MMSKQADQQASMELAIFKIFLACEGAPRSTGLAESRPTPEPDIRCEIDGQNIAFELVELVAAKLAQHVNHVVGVKNLIDEMYQQAESAAKDTMAQRLSNAMIYVRFVRDRNTSKRKRERAIEQLFEWLAEFPTDFIGNQTTSKDSSLGTIIRSVNVSRGTGGGPTFHVEGGIFFSDPIIAAFKDKWSKKYTTDVPIELLAYYDELPAKPVSFWQRKLNDFLTANWSESPFRRVWVCDAAAKAILFSAGKPSGEHV